MPNQSSSRSGGPPLVNFRVYAELNDFLPPGRRGQEFSTIFAREATTKHMIEALGVPHTEVELILVNGQSVGFEHRLHDGDRVSVYPHFAALDIAPFSRVRSPSLRPEKFIADAHLGGLARLLRIAGFDTLYRNDYADREIVDIAAAQGRIVLTRDRDLLKQRAISEGCYLHTVLPAQQFRELVRRFDLAHRLRPFSRCLRCNTLLQEVDKRVVDERLPPSVRAGQTRFTRCPQCRRVFWPGTHWQRMRDLLNDLLYAPPLSTPAESADSDDFRSAILSALRAADSSWP